MTATTQRLYLLDANVLIDAHNLYYPLDMVPEFWEWLLHMASMKRVAMPLETYEEVRGGNNAKKDLFNEWVSDEKVKNQLVLQEEFQSIALHKVMNAYAPDLTDSEVEQVGRDPFLIAYALTAPNYRVVVSNEVSKPSKTRANRKVPDVCRDVGVACCAAFSMLRTLEFRTDWATRL
ncbi:DNA-binding protein [Robbsia andropogonis]|uniref:DNA-binding protein n=1 Tax=Robbsia andropogonis TaxID=28092 RepID=A0A0F5JTI2_9BURK|nr:DUF4411 family protein [Robbsia andropogonis]KKB60964.1 DNA-binding protein [Robbsia andropogonis]